MRREEKFVQSHRPYAIDLASLTRRKYIGYDDGPWQVSAVWFRRRAAHRNGPMRTAACIGRLWAYVHPDPADARDFVTRHTDGRYGGECDGRWDGLGYWGDEDPDEMARHLAILRPMLANHPAVPQGFDGWWTFQ